MQPQKFLQHVIDRVVRVFGQEFGQSDGELVVFQYPHHQGPVKHSPRRFGMGSVRLEILREPFSDPQGPRACLARNSHRQALRLRLVNPEGLVVLPRAAVEISELPAKVMLHNYHSMSG